MSTKVLAKKKKKAAARPGIFTFRNVSLGFIGLLCLGWVGVWIFRIVQNIGLPQIEYSEGFMLYNAHLFGTGQWSWDISQLAGGYMVSFYPPVFYYVLGGLMDIFGYDLVVGRVLVLITFVACCVFIYLIVDHLVKVRIYALIAALLPLCHPFITAWSLFVRVDFMAMAFELAGIYLVIRFWPQVYRRSWWFYLSILLFALAFYTKQSTLAGAAAVVIYIFLKDWRHSLVYAGGLVLAIGIPLLIGSLLTHGQFFNEIVLYQRVTPFIRPWTDIKAYLIVGYIELLPVLLIGVIYAITRVRSLPAIFALVALVVSTVTIARPGGAHNYFFEVILAMSIVCGLALPGVIKLRQWGLIALFGVVLWSLSFSFQLMLYPGEDYKQRVQQAQAIIQDAQYPILSENADIVIRAGKVPYYEPFVFNNLPKFGYWDDNILMEDMSSGRIEYVITQYRMPSKDAAWRFSTTVQEAIVDNYHIVLDAEDTDNGYGFVVYESNRRLD